MHTPGSWYQHGLPRRVKLLSIISSDINKDACNCLNERIQKKSNYSSWKVQGKKHTSSIVIPAIAALCESNSRLCPLAYSLAANKVKQLRKCLPPSTVYLRSFCADSVKPTEVKLSNDPVKSRIVWNALVISCGTSVMGKKEFI